MVDGILSSNESEDKAQKEQGKHEHAKQKEEHEEKGKGKKEKEEEEHIGIIKGAYETLSNITHDAFGKLKNLTGTAAENVSEEAKKQAHEKVNVTMLENLTIGLKEGIESAYETVKNFSAEKLVNANEKLHTAKDMYHNVTEAAGEKMGEAANYTREKMANMTESIANMAEYSLDSMKYAVDYVVTHAKHLSKEQMKKLREMFKAHEL